MATGKARASETIRERLVREEREAQAKRLAEVKAERERAEREAKERAERQRAAKEKARQDAAERAKDAAEQAKRNAEAQAAWRAEERKRVTAQLEKQYVLLERAAAAFDELLAADAKGELRNAVPYRAEMEKALLPIRSNLDDTRARLLNIDKEFERRGIAERRNGPRTPSEAAAMRRAQEAKAARIAKENAE